MDKLRIWHEDDYMRISSNENNAAKTCVVVFSSANDIPREEFVHPISDTLGIFVVDKQLSFGNKIDWDIIVQTIQSAASGKPIITMGFCAGGMLAIYLSKYIKIERVIAITPQFSIHPDLLPKSSYLNRFTNNITSWKFRDIGDALDYSEYIILISHDDDDEYQMSLFPQKETIKIFDFLPDAGHELPKQLGGNLQKYIKKFIANDYTDLMSFLK